MTTAIQKKSQDVNIKESLLHELSSLDLKMHILFKYFIFLFFYFSFLHFFIFLIFY